VGKAKDTPEDHILICDWVIPLSRIRNAINLKLTLHGEPASGIELVISVLGDPNMVTGEQCPLGLN
jgi:hypothetical protein